VALLQGRRTRAQRHRDVRLRGRSRRAGEDYSLGKVLVDAFPMRPRSRRSGSCTRRRSRAEARCSTCQRCRPRPPHGDAAPARPAAPGRPPPLRPPPPLEKHRRPYPGRPRRPRPSSRTYSGRCLRTGIRPVIPPADASGRTGEGWYGLSVEVGSP
jgi:hypothetical protein